MTSQPQHCPVCQSEDVQDGYIGHYPHTFILEERWREPQYKARGFVCLSCGFLGAYLPQDTLSELRKAISK